METLDERPIGTVGTPLIKDEQEQLDTLLEDLRNLLQDRSCGVTDTVLDAGRYDGKLHSVANMINALISTPSTERESGIRELEAQKDRLREEVENLERISDGGESDSEDIWINLHSNLGTINDIMFDIDLQIAQCRETLEASATDTNRSDNPSPPDDPVANLLELLRDVQSEMNRITRRIALGTSFLRQG